MSRAPWTNTFNCTLPCRRTEVGQPHDNRGCAASPRWTARSWTFCFSGQRGHSSVVRPGHRQTWLTASITLRSPSPGPPKYISAILRYRGCIKVAGSWTDPGGTRRIRQPSGCRRRFSISTPSPMKSAARYARGTSRCPDPPRRNEYRPASREGHFGEMIPHRRTARPGSGRSEHPHRFPFRWHARFVNTLRLEKIPGNRFFLPGRIRDFSRIGKLWAHRWHWPCCFAHAGLWRLYCLATGGGKPKSDVATRELSLELRTWRPPIPHPASPIAGTSTNWRGSRLNAPGVTVRRYPWPSSMSTTSSTSTMPTAIPLATRS